MIEAPTGRLVRVKGPRAGRDRHDPRPPQTQARRSRPRSAAADAHAGAGAAPAGPVPAPDLSWSPSTADPDRAADYAALSRDLRRAARRPRRERARRANPSPPPSCPLSRRQLRALEAVVHEKVESWLREPFVDEGRRQATQGPAAALRDRRADHVHALHGRVERARARRPAPARARAPGARSPPCSPPPPATTCCRPASRGCARAPTSSPPARRPGRMSRPEPRGA